LGFLLIKFIYSKEVLEYKKLGKPILALESTIVAHGMPYPDNLNFAKEGEMLCRKKGVAPATIAILNGNVHIGLDSKMLQHVAYSKNVKKVSQRELATAITKKWDGATTVSATMGIAYKVKIPVFATGGIGGVHRNAEKSFDISEDLTALSKTPIIVVSSGAKAILDLPKTLEKIETLGITTLGYNTEHFPAFYSYSSGISNIDRVKSPDEIVNIYKTKKLFGFSSATLIANPIPKKEEIKPEIVNKIIDRGILEADKNCISGKKTTPFLLQYISEKTKGASLKANKSLALNNIKLGIKISKKLSRLDKKSI